MPSASPSIVDRDLAKLHPAFRCTVETLLDRCHAKSWPFAIFEGFRPPARQCYLYEQGRSRPGAIVTKVKPWGSFHQYGLAADIILKPDSGWSWSTQGPLREQWKGMRALAVELGLTVLDWELPHVQWGRAMDALQAGDYPADGDESWAANLAWHTQNWTGSPPAPPAPMTGEDRPGLPNAAELAAVVAPVACASGVWTSRHGGLEWRYDADGVFTRANGVETGPWRSTGAMVTIPAIINLYGEFILEASHTHGVCPQLILMTIATETAFARNTGFTGPRTFRWEPNVKVGDVGAPDRGDYSAGPMQTLASTAREVIKKLHLPYDPFAIAPHYADQPVPPPRDNPLYDPKANIDIGTAEIKWRLDKTGSDPILVAASYNAGGVYPETNNPWHIRCCGDHLDRAAQWYGDACAFLKQWM